MDASSKKASLYLVYSVLKDNTDENHFLELNEISKLINDQFGIEIERKSISNSISLLSELGFDINKGSNNRGFALFTRDFDLTEALFLADAIYSSKAIDSKSAEKLVSKVFASFSKYQRRSFNYLYKSSDITRTKNEAVFYNIELIHEAIQKKKRISFKYITHDSSGKLTYRNNGYEYHVSPYFLINNFGNYYLVCNYRAKYSDLVVYRIDYMADVKISDKYNYVSLKSLPTISKNFDIKNYINEHIYMFGGDIINAKIEILTERGVDYCYDWFGKNISLKRDKDTNSLIATIKCNQSALFYWCMQYNQHIKVLYPESLIELIKKEALDIVSKYQN